MGTPLATWVRYEANWGVISGVQAAAQTRINLPERDGAGLRDVSGTMFCGLPHIN